MFRGWNRLCRNAASADRPVAATKAEREVAVKDKTIKNGTNVPAKSLSGIGEGPDDQMERSALERRGKIVKRLVSKHVMAFLRQGAFFIVLQGACCMSSQCLFLLLHDSEV